MTELTDIQADRQRDLSSKDSRTLYRLAETIKEEGNDELAEEVRQKAIRQERLEDWSYDEAEDNKLQDL